MFSDAVSLLLPPCSQHSVAETDLWVSELISSESLKSFWIRDVAVTYDDDSDVGSLLDPFVYASYLRHTFHDIDNVGVAVVPVGSRTSAVAARAAVSVADLHRKTFHFGLGSGDKKICALGRKPGNEAPSFDTIQNYVEQLSTLLSHNVDSTNLNFQRLSPDTPVPLWVASRRIELIRCLAPLLYGVMGWQLPLSEVRAHVREVRDIAPHLKIATTLNVWPDEDESTPTFVKQGVGMMRMRSEPLRELLTSYLDAGVDQIILNLPSNVQPRRQLKTLTHSLGGNVLERS